MLEAELNPVKFVGMLLFKSLVALAVTSLAMYFIWNYAVVNAVTFAHPTTFFQSVGLTMMINLITYKK